MAAGMLQGLHCLHFWKVLLLLVTFSNLDYLSIIRGTDAVKCYKCTSNCNAAPPDTMKDAETECLFCQTLFLPTEKPKYATVATRGCTNTAASCQDEKANLDNGIVCCNSASYCNNIIAFPVATPAPPPTTTAAPGPSVPTVVTTVATKGPNQNNGSTSHWSSLGSLYGSILGVLFVAVIIMKK